MRFLFFIGIYLLQFSFVLSQNDWGIQYFEYSNGSYPSSKIEFKFIITNHGPQTFPAGTVINTASRIVGTLFALDLLGAGPTPITTRKTLGVGDTMHYNPGYLNGQESLDYFGVNSGEFCLIVYGTNSDPVNLNFQNDPNPSNNINCLTFSNGEISIGILDPKLSSKLEVFPNPAINEINFKLPENFKGNLKIFNSIGNQVFESSITNLNSNINLNNLYSGQYFYLIQNSGKQFSGLFLIK